MYAKLKEASAKMKEGKVWVIKRETNTGVWLDTKIYAENKEMYIHNTTGKIVTMDSNGNSVAVSIDEFYNNRHNYKTHSEGTVPAIDKDGNSIRVSQEEYYTNRELYAHNTDNSVYVTNKETNEIVKVSLDEYYKNKEKYKHSCSGFVIVIDKAGYRIRVSTEEFYNNRSEYKTSTEGSITIIDINGETTRISCEEFKENRDKYQVPVQLFQIVYTRDCERKKIKKIEFNPEIHYDGSDYEYFVRCENKKTKGGTEFHIMNLHNKLEDYRIISVNKFDELKHLNKFLADVVVKKHVWTYSTEALEKIRQTSSRHAKIKREKSISELEERLKDRNCSLVSYEGNNCVIQCNECKHIIESFRHNFRASNIKDKICKKC
jgi:WD40 repeat protein